MRINTNIAALNSQRILGQTNQAVSKQIGRLSSGFRINRAADDAAGLGIANTLRSDLRSMEQASRNSEQANSLLQVAEGASQTIGNILDRMKELAAQSASSNSGDRATLQAEFNTLRNEITRIVDTTEYQDVKLVNGTMGNALDLGNMTLDGNAMVQASTIKLTGAAVDTYTITATGTTITMEDGSGNRQVQTVAATGEQDVNFDEFGVSFRTSSTFDTSTWASSTVEVITNPGGSSAEFLVSSSGDYTGQDLVKLDSAINLTTGTGGLNIDTATIATQGGAQAALASIDSAVDSVNSALATIGATQNRIDFATQNIQSTIENFSAAQSTIRDADMAAEMTELSRVQILQQAGTAMLAQANQAPQGVLQLLR